MMSFPAGTTFLFIPPLMMLHMHTQPRIRGNQAEAGGRGCRQAAEGEVASGGDPAHQGGHREGPGAGDPEDHRQRKGRDTEA